MAYLEGMQSSAKPSPSANGLENAQISVSPKSNHVSSVILYGVPIVSLYIEGQERLCLAQISNTLLKQFSYNEIHNRRVALGITCVQCTPVQLEILRRAGAMPVSSRRCGMITRREAERLCKSFLGDNTPPRLPEDFAFSVQHKCAWGCRGSFLPARYNSSRAKCIKCSYCGMFFSPNKFIFHSHRITTNDRYIQPDAANFNSWRRHMTLSSHGHDEKIIHAWEDVKAMFNGGTRKRLVSCSNSKNSNCSNTTNVNNNNNNKNSSSNSKVKQNSPTANNILEENECSSPHSLNEESICSKRSLSQQCNSLCTSPHICERTSLREDPLCTKRALSQQYNYSTTVAAAAAVVGVTAVAATVGVPFNLHRSSVLTPLQSIRNEHDTPIMPFSRNLVVDYTMWQQHQQQQQQQQHDHQQQHHQQKSNEPSGTASLHNWIRPDLQVLSNTAGSGLRLLDEAPFNVIKNEPSFINNSSSSRSRKTHDDHTDVKIPSMLSSSAFKPVVASASIMSTSLYTSRSIDSISNVSNSPVHATRSTTVFTHNNITTESSSTLPILNRFELVGETNSHHLSTELIAKSISESVFQNVVDDDDEVVDIETTEEDALTVNDVLTLSGPCLTDPSPLQGTNSRSQSDTHSHSQSGSPNDEVDVDGITADVEEHFDIKWNSCSNPNGQYDDKDNVRIDFTKNIEEPNGISGLKRLTRFKISHQQPQRQFIKKCNESKIDTDRRFATQSSLQLPQRVAFPVFLRSHLHSFRQRHLHPPSPSNTTSRQLFCFDGVTGSEENGIE